MLRAVAGALADFVETRLTKPQHRRVSSLLARVMDAVQWLPRDNKEWLVARDRWKRAVLASALSAATKVVAIVIADFYINRNPQNRHFNWAWAAQETLARAAGLTRRTVASAMNELELAKLIVIDRGGGRKGDRGRTHRYTLRMDCLGDQGVHRTEDEQNLHNSTDVHKGTGSANDDVEMGNPRPKEVNGLPTTPSNSSLRDPLYGLQPKPGSHPVKGKWLSKGKEPVVRIQSFVETEANEVSSVDQSDLANFIGNGDLSVGWGRLMGLPDGVVDKMARRFKYDKSSGPAILEQMLGLLEKDARHSGSAD
ncbi:hypothetical protein BN961_03215 [Afipia felis]|uniref:Helix-turn-helix domain-containing protein n=1 Tax=Afipia felis TaxID=1035 RepID=A0A090N8A2_AFIFE|nr:helix-turn-helix domain-containing protein [Afipia felis]CEG09783.1 hypothetical protein BN961_03215 [Afipia felis]